MNNIFKKLTSALSVCQSNTRIEKRIDQLVKGERMAIYFELMHGDRHGGGADIANLLAHDTFGFKRKLNDLELKIGLTITKQEGRSRNSFQAGGYLIFRSDIEAQAVQHILKKIATTENSARGIYIDSDIAYFIDYMITQGKRKSEKDFENIINSSSPARQIEIRPADIESGLRIFPKST